MAAEHREKCDDIGIELPGIAAQELCDRVRGIEAHAIRTLLGDRIVGVGNRNDSARERNIETGQPPRVAAAAEPARPA
jgi:hypothetical protein